MYIRSYSMKKLIWDCVYFTLNFKLIYLSKKSTFFNSQTLYTFIFFFNEVCVYALFNWMIHNWGTVFFELFSQ